MATFINIDNVLDILVTIVFNISPLLGGIGKKSHELLQYLTIHAGKYLPEYHFLTLHPRRYFLMK